MVVGRAAGASRDVELSLAGLSNALPIAFVSFLLVEGVAEGMANKVLASIWRSAIYTSLSYHIPVTKKCKVMQEILHEFAAWHKSCQVCDLPAYKDS